MLEKQNVLQMESITKVFGTNLANNNIHLNVLKNSIHGLLGENGAGKTTLMKILFGLLKPDKGKIFINNKQVAIKNPIDAQKLGIGMVHQHFKFVGIFNSIDNITLGKETKNKWGFIKNKKAKQTIENLSKKYNFNIDLKKPVEELSVSQQQKVEILKILYKDPDILIFDEPTAILSPIEIKSFLKLVKEFKKNGKTVILITHKLDEIKAVCDQATILRKGKFIKEISIKEISPKQMSKLMLGKEIKQAKNNLKSKNGKVVLNMKNICSSKLKNISLNVKAGEIVAIAGIEGNGQQELVEVIMGLNKKFSGNIFYKRKEKDFDLKNQSINQRINLGISYVPEDRQKHGMVLNLDISSNAILSEYNKTPYSKKGLLNFKEIIKNSKQIVKDFDVRGTSNIKTLAKNLSGGNQQKLILGREINKTHKLLVVCQPTRGLDVGSINNIHKFLLKEKKDQKAVLLFSFELEEIFDLADRIIVFFKGQIVGKLSRQLANKQNVGSLMLRGKLNA